MKPLATELITKEDYYKDASCISFSALKVFSRCETLYRDLFIDKTYEEPEYDYFVYGKLVDAMVSEPEDFIPANFVRVKQKVRPEKALKIENEIKELEAEIQSKEEQLKEKPNKTTEKGILGRRAKVAELQVELDVIKQLADKIQVTESIWLNAEETALAIKAHPSFSTMEFNEVTSQQIFTSNRDGIPRKGKLDHLKLSPSLTRFYAIYAAGQMTLAELQERIRKDVHPQDLWAIISDVKTCKDVASLEPFNTHWRGQLGFYQDLVSDTLLIPVENIRCRILVADKLNNDFKKCELFEFTQESLDELKPDVAAWVKIWWERMRERAFVSAKEKHGWNQKCFTCSECRFCPFSRRPGDPVSVSGPRFQKKEEAVVVENGDISTADAALEY